MTGFSSVDSTPNHSANSLRPAPPRKLECSSSAGRAVWFFPESKEILDKSGFLSGQPKLKPVTHFQGRTAHPVFALGENEKYMWKACLRGGLLSKINRRTFFSLERFNKEMIVSDQLSRSGIAVANLIAFSVTRRGIGYHIDQFIRIEEDAISIRDLMLKQQLSPTTEQVRTIADLILQFHDFGFLHGDLNLMNIMINSDRAANPRALLVDLDPGAIPYNADRINNLKRLARSYAKIVAQGGCPLQSGDRYRFLYHAVGGSRELLKSALKECLSQLQESEHRR